MLNGIVIARAAIAFIVGRFFRRHEAGARRRATVTLQHYDFIIRGAADNGYAYRAFRPGLADSFVGHRFDRIHAGENLTVTLAILAQFCLTFNDSFLLVVIDSRVHGHVELYVVGVVLL